MALWGSRERRTSWTGQQEVDHSSCFHGTQCRLWARDSTASPAWHWARGPHSHVQQPCPRGVVFCYHYKWEWAGKKMHTPHASSVWLRPSLTQSSRACSCRPYLMNKAQYQRVCWHWRSGTRSQQSLNWKTDYPELANKAFNGLIWISSPLGFIEIQPH